MNSAFKIHSLVWKKYNNFKNEVGSTYLNTKREWYLEDAQRYYDCSDEFAKCRDALNSLTESNGYKMLINSGNFIYEELANEEKIKEYKGMLLKSNPKEIKEVVSNEISRCLMALELLEDKKKPSYILCEQVYKSLSHIKENHYKLLLSERSYRDVYSTISAPLKVELGSDSYNKIANPNRLFKSGAETLNVENYLTISEVTKTYPETLIVRETEKAIKGVKGFVGIKSAGCKKHIEYMFKLHNAFILEGVKRFENYSLISIKINSLMIALRAALEELINIYVDNHIKLIPKSVYKLDPEVVEKPLLDMWTNLISKLVFKPASHIKDEAKGVFVPNKGQSVSLGLIHVTEIEDEIASIKNEDLRNKFKEVVFKINEENNFNVNTMSLNIPIDKGFSMFFENPNNNELGKTCINNIISSLICDAPRLRSNNIFIDTCYAGNYFTDYSEARGINEKLVGKKIYTTKDEINEILDYLIAEIMEIIQNKLGNKYSSIIEYNKENEDSIEPIRTVTILGFSNLFDSSLINKITNIATNGPRCGVNLIIENTHKSSFGSNKDEIEALRRKMNVILVHGDRITLPNGLKVKGIEAIPYGVTKKKVLRSIAARLTEKEKQGFKLNSIGSDASSSDASAELIIPIGKSNRGEVQSISFGKGVSHHGLIAGQTGSGKSTLLHTIILSGVKNYSPDDLNIYLMDFKEGIEFKLYAKYNIPHIKLIALESQVEFGESILEFMVREIQERGKLFKANEVENLKGYVQKTGKKIPRILLIIDEFTNLFTTSQGAQITRHNAQLMNKIINQGRAFGVNVLMASQTIKNTSDTTLAPETIEQMAVRIGLKCSAMDAAALMGHDNDEINRLGNEIGAAVYNGENGKGENFRFRVAYVDDKERNEILTNVENTYKESYSNHICKVFEGNDSVNVQLDTISPFNNDKNIKLSKFVHTAWIGEPIRIGQPVTIRFNQGVNNLAIISADENQIRSVLIYIIMSIVRQVRLLDDGLEKGMISFIDYNYNILEESNSFKALVEGNNDIIETSDSVPAKILISDLYEEYIRRRGSDNYKVIPRYLIINGMQRARDLLISEDVSEPADDFSLGFPSSFGKSKGPSLSDKFKTLIKDGGNFGIFVVITADSYRNYERVDEKIGYVFRKNINLRVAFNMNGREGDTFVNSSTTEKLNENNAIFYDDITGLGTKFRIYEEPTVDWIEDKFIK
ncbi:FtsK/SpoIIIE domain-containing protein [Clostridium sp.]|uniref:FtsK/SpoIIIE domain-containing protein n=1 Tax=Clostridium sp. TaxID=1506 RepID=UPI003F2C6A82